MERDDVDPATGQIITVLQLFGTGIFADPNDLCLMLTIGIGLSLYRIGDRRLCRHCPTIRRSRSSVLQQIRGHC